MASRMREDEKNEKIIRGLLKLPANRRCINCNSLGPQYVCTNFWTFVCTTCSGIHREFTHRVKSISMAKFTSQEVAALQGGGNERARETYFKEWDPQRHSAPDGSNVDRLRDFIKHVYVDRRYTGERSIDKPPRVKSDDREDSYENRRMDTYRGASRSPPYEDRYERRYGERSGPGGRNDERNYRYNYDERRSPGYDQEGQRYGDYGRSPGRFEVVDDWRRDDRFGNGRKSEERRSSDGESRFDGRSPNRQKDLGASSPPMVRPVRDILGEAVPRLQIGEPPKANGSKIADGSLHAKTASSSSLGSIEGNSVDLKMANSVSLIDFGADPVLPDAAAAPQTQPTIPHTSQDVTHPTSSSVSDNNWASFDLVPQENVSQPPSNVNGLESVLSQLSAPAAAAPPFNSTPTLFSGGVGPSVAPMSNVPIFPGTAGGPAATVGQISPSPSGGAPAIALIGSISSLAVGGSAPTAAPGGMMSTLPVSGGHWPGAQQHQPFLFPANDSQSTVQQLAPSVGGAPNNQPWSSSLAPVIPVPSNSTPTAQQSQAQQTQETNSSLTSQPLPVEAKSSGRTELPVDLFTATYSSIPVGGFGWQAVPPRGMGYGMQYPTAAPMPAFLHPPKSTNPFDLNNDTSVVQAPTFPSMSSLQGALPNIAPHAGLASSLGTSHWMPPQAPSYGSGVPPHAASYAPAMLPSAYVGQQAPKNMLPFGIGICIDGIKESYNMVLIMMEIIVFLGLSLSQRTNTEPSFGS
uniref:Arf-GAP domain-containing protein n=1 Tax=Nelumbo nucifera TaxID=4432 RepID=A0A822XZB5_NELNU|nr:TPA_asm: hypothetical protein HUJ06_028442 [Nelumbo nucifera]